MYSININVDWKYNRISDNPNTRKCHYKRNSKSNRRINSKFKYLYKFNNNKYYRTNI